MITAAFVLATTFLLVLLALMYYSFVADGYEAPATFSDSLKRCAQGLLAAGVVNSLFNVFRFRLSFEKWNFAPFIGVAIAVAILFAVDFISISRRRKNIE